ncbi:hypothetical protein M9H77_20433 [Catharanthus roseus]|uniref:Uncharacterized protein n=1 Tax=Catharanthus roseus TaxID=4058 RepID=A0ACC0AL59_CATRO|nr:hypothetical protein M9H77_20433 [Catharanthus roseus]
MVQPGARRGDDDLCPGTNRTGRVEGHLVTAPSRGSSTQPSPIPFRTRPPTPLHYPYYGFSQPPRTSYDPYAHASSPPLRTLGVPVDSSYSNTDFGVTNCGNPSSDDGLCRDSGTCGDRTRFEEPDMVGSLRIHGSEDEEDQPENVGGDDNDHSDGAGDEDELISIAHASSTSDRLAPGKGKGLTGSFMSVMSKITGSRPKRHEKSRTSTNPTQRKKTKNDDLQ